jgi:formylglycine-generating enzyme required for sulfatase activity
MTSPADGMVMVYVPAGEFLMGSADSDSQASSNEKPQHMVYLDAYWIDQTEVTNAQYARCVAAGKCRPPWSTYSNTHNLYYGEQQFESYPVILVSWDDAQAYCAWVSRRLPTEAEWEKAARGPYGRIYPWGNRQPGCDLANFAGCAGNTSAVGSFPAGASPYGALDVAGNVWEWVQDWYGETYYADSPSNNPDGPSSGQYRVLRGGSWNYNWWDTIRVAYRYFSDPDYRDFDFGFRCGVSPGE